MGLLDGEITVQSDPGRGSTFTVYLPVGRTPTLTTGLPRQASAPQRSAELAIDRDEAGSDGILIEEPRSSRVAEKLFAETNVLVIDDDFRNVFALTALLERGNATVFAAESGPEGIAVLEDAPDMDVILMDIMMPGMDGYATIKAIRDRPRFATVPSSP